MTDQSTKNYDLLLKISTELAVNTEATKKIESHLKELNGKVFTNASRITNLEAHDAEFRAFMKKTQLEHSKEDERLRKYLFTGVKIIATIVAVLFFNLLLRTGVITQLTKIPI